MAAVLRHVDVAHAAVAAHPTWAAAAAVWVAAAVVAAADIVRHHRVRSVAAVDVAEVAAVVVASAPAPDVHVVAEVAVARPGHPAAAREGGRRAPEVAAPRAARAENHRLSLPTLLGSGTLASLEVELLDSNLRSP